MPPPMVKIAVAVSYAFLILIFHAFASLLSALPNFSIRAIQDIPSNKFLRWAMPSFAGAPGVIYPVLPLTPTGERT